MSGRFGMGDRAPGDEYVHYNDRIVIERIRFDAGVSALLQARSASE